MKGVETIHRHTVTNYLHSAHAPDLIKIGKEVREVQQSEDVLASPRPILIFLGRLEYSNLLRVVDQLLTFASYLIK